MATIKNKFNFDEICVSFICRNRFYALILSKLNKVATTKISTAAVGLSDLGKIVLYYNEKFFEGLDLAQAQAVLEHEVLHVFYKHITRLPGNKTNREISKLTNLACDVAINQYLPDLPEGGVYPKTYNLEEGMFAEWYFVELKKKNDEAKKEQQQEQQQSGGQGNEGKPQDNQDGEGEEQEEKLGGICDDHDTLDDHDMWGKTINEEGEVEEVSDDAKAEADHEADRIIKQAIEETENDKSRGNLPEDIQKQIEAYKQIKIVKTHDWKRELRMFVQSVLTPKKKLSQKRVNKRFLNITDYYMPGKKKSRNPRLIVARDTSGSVFDSKTQMLFINEIVNIAQNCEVIVVDCDAEIQQITYNVKKVEDFKDYEGGGGTSFIPVFEEARKQHVDGIIYLTDLMGSFPKQEDIGTLATHTIWVTVNMNNNLNVPFGKHVNITNTEQES